MSSPKYEPPSYEIPAKPSKQLAVVLDYFNCLRIWDLKTLSQLSTPDFTQVTLPASLAIPARSKSEDIEFLHKFRDSLKGAPLDIRIYDVNESKGKIWVHLMMKTVKVECFFLFNFGTGKDENLIINVTEFVDSKVFSGGSTETKPNAQPETPIRALSSSVRNCLSAMRQCSVDILLFLPRSLKYGKSGVEHKDAHVPGAASGKSGQ